MKNKKAMEGLIKIILWIIFFLIAGAAAFFIIKQLTNLG